MRCPSCGQADTRVVDSRDLDDAASIRRRRECNLCATRFTTYERIESARLAVVKSDGGREEFDRAKLASGLAKALTRRPVADDAAQKAAEEIDAALRAQGLSEVPSRTIGEMAMAKLRELDQIAYIRFASVYQSFEDIEQLRREVDSLLAEREEVEREVEDPSAQLRGGGGGLNSRRFPKR
ncbi:MAG TPA: transcriptional regulator NrdR [Candidatus Limnocylindrales bacterium]|nr:transcriptional regulator NrdR [Candidatus Limnocylindrales bacterium]